MACAVALVSLSAFMAPDALAAMWKYHPAVDDFPMRIVGGNGNTYFLVFQRMYKTGTNSYSTPHVAVFRHSEARPSAGIVPLANEVSLNGANVCMAEYSPEGKFLALVYDDGGIDFVSDSGEVRHCDMLKRVSAPGMNRLNSLTLCGTEAWIATEAGYAAADGLTGEPIDIADIGKQVKWAARVGDRIVIITDNALRVAPSAPFPRNYSVFSALGAAGIPQSPKMLMPLSDTAFGYLAVPAANAGTYSLNVAWLDGGAWKTRKIQDLWLPTAPTNAMVANLFERNVTRNRDGWLLVTSGNFFQLHKDRNPAEGEILETLAANLSQNVGGSPDLQNFWTYVSRGEFRHGHREGTNVYWDEETVRPKAPVSQTSTSLQWSNKYGVACPNYGYSWIFRDMQSSQPPLISTYKDNTWGTNSPVYNTPASAEADPALMNLFNSYKYRFPLSDPTGIAFDPVNPDYLWLGSVFGGLAAINMSSPKSDPLHLGSAADPLSGYPGFREVFPDVTVWKGYTPVSVPSFDADGTLWSTYAFIDWQKENRSPMRLFYITADGRRDALARNDVSALSGMGFIELPVNEGMNANMYCVAMKSAKNRNLVASYVSADNRHLIVTDHNGTLDNTSDDEYKIIRSIRNQSGGVWNLAYCYAMAEDPLTGEVWFSSGTQLFSFNPTAKPEAGVMPGRVLDVEYGELQGNPFDNIAVHNIAFDDRNRMWLSTDEAGVWCISADRKRVEVHYTVENSGIPSDTAYGMAWNPETQSLMISTAEGLAEVFPELPSQAAADEDSPSVSPRNVSADYAGGVVIRGLSGNARVAILDCDGHVVTGFDADPSGAAVWNLTDSEGRPVATGIYRIESSASDFEPVEITVMR